MDLGDFEHWGVVVRPGETVKCDPGEIYCHISQAALHAGKGNEDVRLFVKVAGQEILLCTLSADKYPQFTTDLVFDKEFELLHTSKTSNISVIGFKFSGLEKSYASSEDEDSNDEAPLAIPLYPNGDDDKRKETKDDEGKAVRPVATATQSSKPKAALEETKNLGKMKADIGGNEEDDSEQCESDDDDDEDSSDEVDSENSDKDDFETDFPEKAKSKKRPVATPSKTPPVKKAKVELSSPVDHKTGSGTAKKSGHVHVATPYPSKKVKKGYRGWF